MVNIKNAIEKEMNKKMFDVMFRELDVPICEHLKLWTDLNVVLLNQLETNFHEQLELKIDEQIGSKSIFQ